MMFPMRSILLASTPSAKRFASASSDGVHRTSEIESVTKHDVIAFLTHLAEHVGSDEARFVHQGMTVIAYPTLKLRKDGNIDLQLCESQPLAHYETTIALPLLALKTLNRTGQGKTETSGTAGRRRT